MDPYKIAEAARSSIGKYCMSECNAYCCRKGYLRINEEQVELLSRGRRAELEDKKILAQESDGFYMFFLGGEIQCPCLEENKCLVHSDSRRPDACKDYPLFIENKIIRLSQRCPAVRAGKFFPFVKELIMRGYKLSET